jgi:hypothetical protein
MMHFAIMTTDTLAMEPTAFSSGIPVSYRVLGLSGGQTAELRFKKTRRAEIWKVRFGGRGKFSGQHDSAELALMAIQNGRITATKGDTSDGLSSL